MAKREREGGGGRLLVQSLPSSATYEWGAKRFVLPMFTEGSSELPVLSVMVSVGNNAFPMTFGHHRLLAAICRATFAHWRSAPRAARRSTNIRARCDFGTLSPIW